MRLRRNDLASIPQLLILLFLTRVEGFSFGRGTRWSGSFQDRKLFMSSPGIVPDGGVSPCVIKVVGVGGGGGNAVMRMIETGVDGVEFLAINTDAQALSRFKGIARVLNIGQDVTRGLGAGGLPENGRKAAEESRNEIMEMVAGSDLVFVTAGMGGGTGSGAAPIVAEVAREAGALTVGVVTKPFGFEGRRRMQQALQAIEKLRGVVDTLIIVSNDRLLQIIPENTPLQRAFSVADDVLRQGVVGISEIIIRPGLINVDFADVRTIMGDAGTALMGIGRGAGRSRAQEAASSAISSPLLDFPIEKARGVVFNIVGGIDLTLQEINAAAEVIYEAVDPEANIIFGALVDDSMEGEIAITVIATGFPDAVSQGESQQALLGQGQRAPLGDQQQQQQMMGGRVMPPAPQQQQPPQQQQQQQRRGSPPPPPPPLQRGAPLPPAPIRRRPAPAPAAKRPMGRRPVAEEEEEYYDDDDVPDFMNQLKRRR